MATQPSKPECAHSACHCEVDAGQTYCSPYCANQVTEPVERNETRCGCGHPQCAGGGHSALSHA